MADDDAPLGWCSWCLEKTRHERVARRRLSRDAYRCGGCGQRTHQCRFCENMAQGRPDALPDATLARLRATWNDEFCAEHDGTLVSFETAKTRLPDLADYEQLVAPEKRAPWRAAAEVLPSLVGSVSLAGRVLRLPALVTPALFWAEVAWAIGRSYLGPLRDFRIEKLREGSEPGVLLVRGFGSEGRSLPAEWTAGLSAEFPRNALYVLSWESKGYRDIGRVLADGASRLLSRSGVGNAAGGVGRLSAAVAVPGLITNPWHTAMVRAARTGRLLASVLERADRPRRYVLVGHSLGARVIYYLLGGLSESGVQCVDDVYLLGGAVGRGDRQGWENASRAVAGTLVNCHSADDRDLRWAYRVMNAFLSDPVGLGPVGLDAENAIDLDVSDLVAGHRDYKSELARILERARRLQSRGVASSPMARRRRDDGCLPG
jgi:hypothetical protein